MKPLTAITFLLFLLAPGLSHAGFLQEQDKQKHMAISAIGATSFYLFNNRPGHSMSKGEAFGLMLTIGIAKELHDGNRNTTKEHFRDLAADILGAGIVFTYRF